MKLYPIKMYPKFRYGDMTPWGGNKLKTLFGKNIPDDRTGEALEVSAVKGLNSVDEQGNPLSALIEKYQQDLVGTEIKGEFPLLLKLLDAKEKLSVQVHPDDAYAKENENKLGKTEAWVILEAGENASLIFGIKEGVTKDTLQNALQNGTEVQKLLNVVPVQKGDVLYIPSGMVHAITEDIVLYEIQQSSDVTYRFYDWDRKDKNGNKRELHIKKALDVTNLQLPAVKATPVRVTKSEQGTDEVVLDNDFFCLERILHAKEYVLNNTPEYFKILTAIEQGTVKADDQVFDLKKGESMILPANGYDLLLTGDMFLLAYTRHA